MPHEQVIDFTKNDIGVWLLYVVIPLLALSKVKERTARGVVVGLLSGAAVATPLVLALAVYQRTPPQYFVRMVIDDDQVRLVFRWPKDDVVIPVERLTNVSIWQRHSVRRKFKRIQIDTSTGTYRSYGFNRLPEESLRAIEQLNSGVKRRTKLP